jgi:hypothetical protein
MAAVAFMANHTKAINNVKLILFKKASVSGSMCFS